MTTIDREFNYWKECIEIAADECGAMLTAEQLEFIAGSAQCSHENYRMAFYSPPASDRLNDIEYEWKAKHAALQREFDTYRNNAEKAVKVALKQRNNANVSIGEYGQVFLYCGRTEQIQ